MKKTKFNCKSVAIYCHHSPAKEKEEASFIREMIRFFHAHGVKTIHGDIRSVSMLHNAIGLVNEEKSYDLKIGLGGDGTLLKMIRTLHRNDGLLLGINFGTLGFLSELQPDNGIKELEKIFNGEFIVDERIILKSFVYRKNSKGNSEKVFRSYGLNEIVFGHGGQARLTNFNVQVNNRFLSKYRSDGLIFSTPTGSTAYSMSAGGPIVSPSISTILVTPVAPHVLSHRPILLPGGDTIKLRFDARVDAISMTIDGQIHFSLKSTDSIILKKATRTAKFIRLKPAHYFKSLRKKLGWGS